jgi:hypothetical protein
MCFMVFSYLLTLVAAAITLPGFAQAAEVNLKLVLAVHCRSFSDYCMAGQESDL